MPNVSALGYFPPVGLSKKNCLGGGRGGRAFSKVENHFGAQFCLNRLLNGRTIFFYSFWSPNKHEKVFLFTFFCYHKYYFSRHCLLFSPKYIIVYSMNEILCRIQ